MTDPTPTTALAQPSAAPLVVPAAKREFALFDAMSAAVGLTVKDFLAVVKRGSTSKGCSPTDTDVAILCVQAHRFDLDPLSSPPEIQLLDIGNGPQVYARVDAYKKFIRAAKKNGELKWCRGTEGWFPDPREDPKGGKLARGFRVVGQLTGEPEPVERIVWWHEWYNEKNPNWRQRGSQMITHRGYKEWCRDYIGYTIADEDDAWRAGDANREERRNEPKRAEAEVRDATPAVPIVGLRPPLPLAPPPLEEPPQSVPAPEASERTTSGPGGDAAARPEQAGSTPAPASAAEPFDADASRRLDAEAAAEQAKREGKLFS